MEHWSTEAVFRLRGNYDVYKLSREATFFVCIDTFNENYFEGVPVRIYIDIR